MLSNDELDQLRAMLTVDVSGYPDKNVILLTGAARKLLVHIDALTAAVDGLPGFGAFGETVERAAVRAILRGEQELHDA